MFACLGCDLVGLALQAYARRLHLSVELAFRDGAVDVRVLKR